MSASQPKTYTQGHHRAVTANHATRTAEVEGAFVLPHLKPDYHILDLGCGPGTISTGVAKYVPQGSVTGLDLSPDVIAQANELLSQQDPPPANISFATGNVLEGLSFEDAKFDVAFCSQTLLHIHDPIAALKELKRVLKPTGFLAAREADFPFRWTPYLPGLQLLNAYLYKLVFGATEVPQPDNAPQPEGYRGGSQVHVWARKAGFNAEKMEKGARTTVYATVEERKQYSEIMIGRIEIGGHRERFVELGARGEEVDRMVGDLRAWAEDVDGWGCIVQCEVVCWV